MALPTSFTMPDGTVYSLRHMDNIYIKISVTVNGTRYLIPVVVIFSSHCYTDGKNGTVQMTDELYFHTDSTGHRAFCERRYKTSLELPDKIRNMIQQPKQCCYRLNKASNYISLQDSSSTNKWMGWYLFFTFDRSKHGKPAALRVSITSYHYRMDKPDNIGWRGSFKFEALVANWLRDRKEVLELFAKIEETK